MDSIHDLLIGFFASFEISFTVGLHAITYLNTCFSSPTTRLCSVLELSWRIMMVAFTRRISRASTTWPTRKRANLKQTGIRRMSNAIMNCATNWFLFATTSLYIGATPKWRKVCCPCYWDATLSSRQVQSWFLVAYLRQTLFGPAKLPSTSWVLGFELTNLKPCVSWLNSTRFD